MTYNIAVYGTLKKGKSNHDLLRGQSKITDAYIGKGYSLAIDGLPYLVEDAEGFGCAVEVYRINEETIKDLDKLEGHPDFYRRKLIPVYEPTGHKFLAWVYIYQGNTRGPYVFKF